MSRVEKRQRVTTHHEYLMLRPASIGDLHDAIAFAMEDRVAAGLQTDSDDCAWIDSDDEHIILYWEASDA